MALLNTQLFCCESLGGCQPGCSRQPPGRIKPKLLLLPPHDTVREGKQVRERTDCSMVPGQSQLQVMGRVLTSGDLAGMFKVFPQHGTTIRMCAIFDEQFCPLLWGLPTQVGNTLMGPYDESCLQRGQLQTAFVFLYETCRGIWKGSFTAVGRSHFG